MNKSEWRLHLRQLLQTRKVEAHDAVNAHLLEYLKTQTGVWAGYCSLPHEPTLQMSRLRLPQIVWTYPLVEGEGLRWLTQDQGGFRIGKFSIQEPRPELGTEYTVGELAGVLIPGLGFDQQGHRLGWGKGYYDRALAAAPLQQKKIGVAWSVQVVERLPWEEHDIQVDFLLTEKGLQKINKGTMARVN